MAPYSGFKSKTNEAYYDGLVFKMIQLLSYKVLSYSTTVDGAGNNSDPSLSVLAFSKSDTEKYEHYVWVKKIAKIQ
jgi:hypothetical protein